MAVEWKFETRAIKSIETQYTEANPVSMPIYLSTTYRRNTDGNYNEGFVYSSHDNPNRRLLEGAIADLEHGAVSIAFASGLAAVSAIFQSLETGAHVILADDVFHNTRKQALQVMQRWGLHFSIVDMGDLGQVRAAINDNTQLLWIETPSNPQLKIADMDALVTLAREYRIKVAVDNTWLTPVLFNPLDHGADMVVHSTTKYFGGHSDVLSGCVVLKHDEEMARRIREIQLLSGGVPSPFDCWLITRGISTLHLRVMAQTKSAQKIAEFLANHPQIEKVNYPGLKSHPQHAIAKKQLPRGYGAMLSMLVKGDAENAMRVSNKLKILIPATSLGGVESLVEHRKSVEGPDSPTPDNLLRMSVGLEHVDDLIADWEQALG